MPTLVPVDHDPFADAGPVPSTALPAPGDPTSFTGSSAAGMTTPSRLSPDTMRAFAIDLMANGGKGAASILTQDPGTQYAKAYATKEAGDNEGVANLQNAVKPVLRRVQDFQNIATQAGPDVLGKATGPDFGGPWIPLPDTASPMYQNIRQKFQHLNPFSDQDSYTKATDANLEMAHLKDAVAAAFKNLPGAGANGATDQAQRTVDSMLGHAMHSQDPETFYKIAHDAMNTIRGFARLPDLPGNPQSNYVPSGVPGWPGAAPQAQGGTTAAAQPAAPATGGFKYLGKLP